MDDANTLKMDFISQDALKDKSSIEKIFMIVERVKKGEVIVLEGGLEPEEEAELIETTMREIDVESFVGIDIYTLEKNETSFLGLSKRKTVGITIIGPANIMKQVKRKSNFISMVASLGGNDASMY
ncbi:MAG: DUF2073 domain-containing protein [Methanobacteriaceae archaeon]|nr:DUF2073 domain-containing protein [Methanobacteriaceae archaeon]